MNKFPRGRNEEYTYREIRGFIIDDEVDAKVDENNEEEEADDEEEDDN